MGTPVVVDFERLDGLSSVAWVRPGVIPITDPHARVPGLPRLLTAAERGRIGSALLVVA